MNRKLMFVKNYSEIGHYEIPRPQRYNFDTWSSLIDSTRHSTVSYHPGTSSTIWHLKYPDRCKTRTTRNNHGTNNTVANTSSEGMDK